MCPLVGNSLAGHVGLRFLADAHDERPVLSHRTDLGQDGLCRMALPVTTPITDGGPIPHTAASNRRNVAGCLRDPTALSSTGRSSSRSTRRERHHNLPCSFPLPAHVCHLYECRPIPPAHVW